MLGSPADLVGQALCLGLSNQEGSPRRPDERPEQRGRLQTWLDRPKPMMKLPVYACRRAARPFPARKAAEKAAARCSSAAASKLFRENTCG